MKNLKENLIADLELIKAIQSDDKFASERAFNNLYKKYHDSMLFHFKGIMKNEEMAEDLIMEAFEKMYLNLNKFNKETAAFSTWLFKITQNLLIDRLRKNKGNVVCLSDMVFHDEEGDYIEYNIQCPDDTPEIKLLSFERNKKISEIINAMKNKELAEVIKMRFFEEMTYEEISKKIHKPIGTVKGFIFRAKAILKEEFEKSDIYM